jgi:hypothetical protein
MLILIAKIVLLVLIKETKNGKKKMHHNFLKNQLNATKIYAAM